MREEDLPDQVSDHGPETPYFATAPKEFEKQFRKRTVVVVLVVIFIAVYWLFFR